MKVYTALLKYKNLTIAEKIILSKIQSYKENSNIVFSDTNEQLATELCLSKATVKRAIASLEEKGLIKQFFNKNRRVGITVCSQKFNKILRIN